MQDKEKMISLSAVLRLVGQAPALRHSLMFMIDKGMRPQGRKRDLGQELTSTLSLEALT
jgi:hypothetical protein